MPVVFSKLHHAVLNNVKGRLVVAHVIGRAFEGTFLDAFQKIGEFSGRGQWRGLSEAEENSGSGAMD
jgi:hypothetical protein